MQRAERLKTASKPLPCGKGQPPPSCGRCTSEFAATGSVGINNVVIISQRDPPLSAPLNLQQQVMNPVTPHDKHKKEERPPKTSHRDEPLHFSARGK